MQGGSTVVARVERGKLAEVWFLPEDQAAFDAFFTETGPWSPSRPLQHCASATDTELRTWLIFLRCRLRIERWVTARRSDRNRRRTALVKRQRRPRRQQTGRHDHGTRGHVRPATADPLTRCGTRGSPGGRRACPPTSFTTSLARGPDRASMASGRAVCCRDSPSLSRPPGNRLKIRSPSVISHGPGEMHRNP